MKLPRPRPFSGRSRTQTSASVPAEKERDFKLEKVCRLCRQYRQGVAAVEFAIVAPVFFLMILGMIEIGRGVMVQQIITNLNEAGYIEKHRQGRSNRYVIHPEIPMRHHLEKEHAVGDVLQALGYIPCKEGISSRS